jgi:hypothetical protein
MAKRQSKITVDLDPDRPIWGALAIAEVINRPERQTKYLLETRRPLAGCCNHFPRRRVRGA